MTKPITDADAFVAHLKTLPQRDAVLAVAKAVMAKHSPHYRENAQCLFQSQTFRDWVRSFDRKLWESVVQGRPMTEPYLPTSIKMHWLYHPGDDAVWVVAYTDYLGKEKTSYAHGRDELAVYIHAIKYLARLKKRADNRKTKKKEQTNGNSR